ncbi:PIN domain-containing protein [Desulfobacterales bacterium HSG16]|nr:PIN domain-containing protein [Desulfobacterales bacterium HSG16]
MMNVYVESNFILELALKQEQCSSCDAIMSLGEKRNIKIILPAFSLSEPYDTVIRRSKGRESLTKKLALEMQQLSRSEPYKNKVEVIQQITSFLVQSIEDEQERLTTTLEKLLQVAETIPLEKTILSSSVRFQKTFGFSPQDAIIYASVLEHLQLSDSDKNCFLNRNSRDFNDPNIVNTLEAYNCKMLFSFERGYNYINSQIKD